MDGWVDGSQSRVKDCLQQSKILLGGWMGRKDGWVAGQDREGPSEVTKS